jgi:hypothetical protein
MADRKGLAIIGLILGGVTLATVTVAGAIVQWHLDGRLSFDEARAVTLDRNDTLVLNNAQLSALNNGDFVFL